MVNGKIVLLNTGMCSTSLPFTFVWFLKVNGTKVNGKLVLHILVFNKTILPLTVYFCDALGKRSSVNEARLPGDTPVLGPEVHPEFQCLLLGASCELDSAEKVALEARQALRAKAVESPQFLPSNRFKSKSVTPVSYTHMTLPPNA